MAGAATVSWRWTRGGRAGAEEGCLGPAVWASVPVNTSRWLTPASLFRKPTTSRRRAWRELQRLRQLLALVVDDLPPAAKPASFEAEGALLRAALAKAIAEPWRRLAELEAARPKHRPPFVPGAAASAVEGINPYLSNTLNDGTYPMVVNSMNRAMHRPRPERKRMDAMRGAASGREGA
jgi:hypothetical protein